MTDSSAAGSVVVHAQPWWYGRLWSVLSTVGTFITLPASPVYTSEEFSVGMYASTGGNALETYNIQVLFDVSLLEYVSFSSSSR